MISVRLAHRLQPEKKTWKHYKRTLLAQNYKKLWMEIVEDEFNKEKVEYRKKRIQK